MSLNLCRTLLASGPRFSLLFARRNFHKQPNFIGIAASVVWHNRKGFGFSWDGDLVLVTPQPMCKLAVDGYDFSKLFHTAVPDPATLLPRIQGKSIIDPDLWVEGRRCFSTINTRGDDDCCTS